MRPTNAQMVQKCCGTSNSTFLWGSPTSSHTQSLYLPSDLSNLMEGDIERLYYRYGTTGIMNGNVLTNVVITMGQTSQTGFTGGNMYFTGLDTVLTADTLTIAPGVTGDWFGMDLDVLFPYDSTLTLIIDIFWTSSATSNLGCYGQTNNGRKLYSNNNTSPTGNTTSTTWQDMGFDLRITTAVDERAAAAPWLHPNPASHALYVRLPGTMDIPRSWHILDALGRLELTGTFNGASGNGTVEVETLPAGPHILLIDGLLPARFLKE